MLLKFATYSEFYSKTKPDKIFCVSELRKLLIRYRKIEWFKVLNAISKGIFLGDDLQKIRETQIAILGSFDCMLFHRRANLALAQFLFATESNNFSYNVDTACPNDIQNVYLLINEYLDLKETESFSGDNESIFFNTFKIVHTSFNASDLRITLYLYQDYYEKIQEADKSSAINDIISDRLGLNFETVSAFLRSLNSPNNKTIGDPFKILEGIVGINYNSIDEAWKSRQIKSSIPYEYSFLENNAIIKHNAQFYVYDIFNLFYGLIRKVYDILFNQSVFDFPDFFGKEIIEPILVNRYREQFSQLKILKVQFGNYEYSDFGIVYKDKILLFEIKSTFFKPKIRYTQNPSYFFTSFDGKYVSTSGINQQVKRIHDLDKKYETFKKSNQLENSNYTVYPILVAFDESFQCFNCNWYLNNKYREQKKNLDLSNVSISDQYTAITVNEMEMLRNKTDNVNDQLNMLLEFSSSSEKMKPFRTFIENRNSEN